MSDEKAFPLRPLDWENYGPAKWLKNETFRKFFALRGIENEIQVYSGFSRDMFLDIVSSPYMKKYATDEWRRHMAEIVVKNEAKERDEEQRVRESRREVQAKLDAHAQFAAAEDGANPEFRKRLDKLKPPGFGERWPPAGL